MFLRNTLECLVDSCDSCYDEEHNRVVGNVCHMQMIQLRQMSILKKEDICGHDLLGNLCSGEYFSRNTFQLLVEWDPTSLGQPNASESIPLHYTSCISSIQCFQSVFETGIIYYPLKKGISLLFTKNNKGHTSFQFACETYGRDTAMDVVEETITRYYSEETPLNIVDALLT